MIVRDIGLCGVPHRVTEIDRQVIFLSTSGFSHSQFTLEWNGVGWDFVDFEATHEKIYVPHIAAALAWCDQHYRRDYVNGTATVHYTDEIIEQPQH